MFYPDNDTGIDVMPEIAAKRSDTVKWFTKGGKGIAPTVPGQDTWNIWQAELLNILNLAGIKPDKTKLDQIAQAILLIAGAAAEGKIDGDIAYRDKENRFQKKNYFDGEVCVNGAAFFNGGVSIDRGDTIYWGGRDSTASAYLEHHVQGGRGGNTPGLWFCISGYDTGGKFYFRGTPVGGGVADGGRELSPLVVEYVDDGGQIQHYNVYHEGNLDPVMSIDNSYFPDEKGNINLNMYPGPGQDGSYAMVTFYLSISTESGTRRVSGIDIGQLIEGSRIFSGTDPYGVWQSTGSASAPQITPMPEVKPTATVLARRYPVLSIDKLINLRDPVPIYSGSITKGYTLESIDLTCNIDGVVGDVIFTASPNDYEEYGRQVYENAVAGVYGVLPPLPSPGVTS
ncbi:hypothetical protein SNT97_001313 [Salmonella enterica]|nr:hypothetical protein [Salmonella enterica]EBR0085623.1 hypothetical protein [Salmonella enterica subsp. enterica serovar Wangata]EDT2941823.1 hypothetical protein [Salmonella enterica subsp. enterica]EDA8652394.1 hypothetical protein [Salmonella enterica subsp. enterica serovar Wangata]EGA9536920.1 hypothetical protein [Salmonella enterica]